MNAESPWRGSLFPPQGSWTEEEYLQLTDGRNVRVEFTDGQLEFLPPATEAHQTICRSLFLALLRFVEQRELGKVHFAGLRIRIRPDKVREPDVIFLHKDNYHARHNRVWDGADLVMEVVSDYPKDRERDYETKLADYAEAGVREYWIADPNERVIFVHRLQEESFALHGRFQPGQTATSALLEEFSINVAELFATIDDIPE